MFCEHFDATAALLAAWAAILVTARGGNHSSRKVNQASGAYILLNCAISPESTRNRFRISSPSNRPLLLFAFTSASGRPMHRTWQSEDSVATVGKSTVTPHSRPPVSGNYTQSTVFLHRIRPNTQEPPKDLTHCVAVARKNLINAAMLGRVATHGPSVEASRGATNGDSKRPSEHRSYLICRSG